MQPLFKRTVFTSKLYDFLSDNSTEECSLSANRTSWIDSSVVNNGFIDAFNCFCSLCFSLFVDALGKRKYLCLVTLAWIPVMLLMESVDCSKAKMKLNWSSKVSKITVLDIATGTCRGILVACFKIVVGNCLSNFDVFYQALSGIITKLSCVQFDLESEGSLYAYDLDWLPIVDFFHAFDFNKLDMITFLVRVSFILVDSDRCFLFIGYRSYNKGFCLFSVCVRDQVLITVVKEGVTSCTQSFR